MAEVQNFAICGTSAEIGLRRAGKEAPINATVGSTCEGIQKVVPYVSNCGGIK